jgi:hypothetical protein
MQVMSNAFHRTAVRFIRILFVALLAAPAMTQQAQPARYSVEIIVFRTGGDVPSDAAAGAAEASGAGLQATLSTNRRLSDAASRLRAAGGYRVLGHAAWTQSPAAFNSRRGVSVSQLDMGGSGLSGTVILERGQYLHLGFDLRVTDGSRSWVINEVRRVKTNERQYFDHPAVGIIALVTPAG